MQCNIDVEIIQHRAVRFVFNDYFPFRHVSPMTDVPGWDSLEHRRFVNQMCTFYKIYERHVAISLPAEMSQNTRDSRRRDCAPFHQHVTSNDAYKFYFYPSAIGSWNSSRISVIPESLSNFKDNIAQCRCCLLFIFYFIYSYIYLSFIILNL